MKRNTGNSERKGIIEQAINDNYNTLVFSLYDKFFRGSPSLLHGADYKKLIKRNSLIIEAGGYDLSELLPESLFLFHSGLFRMEQGKRKKHIHFCPTNPKTISIITERCHKLFLRVLPFVTPPRIFHLFPDKDHELTWCSCPACRAFSPAEQNLMAVNCASRVLSQIDPDAKISYYDYNVDDGSLNERGIAPGENMFHTKNL